MGTDRTGKMIGVDVIELSRMREILDRSGTAFMRRVFTPSERARALAGDPVRFLASAFAAKEAVFKALELDDWPDGFDFPQIEIGRDPAGRPTARLLGTEVEQGGTIHLSISYETDLAVAIAFISPGTAANGN